MHDALKITRQGYLNDKESYKSFSVRVKDSTLAALDRICKDTNRSRNEIINIILLFGIKNIEITDEQQ